MRGYFNATLIGNTGGDAQFQVSQSGVEHAYFSVASNSKAKQADGSYADKTTWVNVTCFGKLAEVARDYVKKGKPVMVAGSIELDEYFDRNSGEKRNSLKLIARDLVLLGSKDDAQQQPAEDAGFDVGDLGDPLDVDSIDQPALSPGA